MTAAEEKERVPIVQTMTATAADEKERVPNIQPQWQRSKKGFPKYNDSHSRRGKWVFNIQMTATASEDKERVPNIRHYPEGIMSFKENVTGVPAP